MKPVPCHHAWEFVRYDDEPGTYKLNVVRASSYRCIWCGAEKSEPIKDPNKENDDENV